MAHKLTACTFCGVGCGIYLVTAGNRVVGTYPSKSHPTSAGRLCVRGWHVHEVISPPDRLKHPLLKKNGQFQQATWDEALNFIAERLQEIRRHDGADAIAFFNSPRCSNEETYLLQKLARTLVGTNNVDHGAGVYCNNSIHALVDMLGVPASTNSIGELARSNVIVVEGVDLNRQLPTVAGVVLRAKLQGAKLIVIDTRRHRVAESADIFLQIKPGTEALLCGAMAKIIVDRGLMKLPFIKARCTNYDAFLNQVLNFDLLESAEECGVSADLIEAAAMAYARAESAALLYSTGVETRSTQSIQALVNLVLLTGNLGKEGAGLFPLTEQNNLQGVCDVGMLPDRLPGYRLVTDSPARAALESLWNTPLPAAPGFSANQALGRRANGRVQAMWLCRYDPVKTACFGDAAQSLGQCKLVVAQHMFLTESAKLAHVVLPTTSFGEERVTFTSTERRIQLADRVIDPPPGAMPAWEQLAKLGRIMGADWNYSSSAEVMDEIGRAVPFYSGASHDNLAAGYGRQWPCTKEQPMGTPWLFAQGNGHASFKFAPLPPPENPPHSAEFPLTLVFGHSLYYWHQNVVISHSETLKREYRLLLLDYPDGFVEINTDDAQRLGIRDGQKIRLRSASGWAVSTARVTHEVRGGTIFAPYFVRQLKTQLLDAAPKGTALVQVRVEQEVA